MFFRVVLVRFFILDFLPLSFSVVFQIDFQISLIKNDDICMVIYDQKFIEPLNLKNPFVFRCVYNCSQK